MKGCCSSFISGNWLLKPEMMNPTVKRDKDAVVIRLISSVGVINILKGALLLSVLLNLYIFLDPKYFHSSSPRRSHMMIDATEENELRIKLEETAMMPNRTVILTYLNEAWIAPNSMFDLFLESFRIGNNTQQHLKHLLIVSLDEKAHQRCLSVHPHCYQLPIDHLNVNKEASYKTPDYFKIVWRKIDLLRTVLTLGFNFLFTDGDIVWLRDPFTQLDLTNSHFQVACEEYTGDPWNFTNVANTGFMYVESNPQTILFYKLWYSERINYDWKEDQQVFNIIRNSPEFNIIGLRVKFLDTIYFNGFCQETRDYNKVCTVHATCRIGLTMKENELKMVLQQWRNYTSLAPAAFP